MAEAQNPDYVEVYLDSRGGVSHVWVHFTEPFGRFVEVPVKLVEEEV